MDATASSSRMPSGMYSSVRLPYTPLSPSPSSLLPNDDGQFAVVTRAEINIFTPSYGLQVDSSAVKVGRAGGVGESEVEGKGKNKAPAREMPLFRTLIAVEKKDIVDWAGWSKDTRAVAGAAGSPSESYWRAATWSPTGLSKLGGCVLATLSTNQEVLIFEPSKNSHRGEWAETFDLTSTLARVVLPQCSIDEKPMDKALQSQEEIDLTIKVLECQASSIAWSSAVDGGFGDFSLLMVGHRSGHLSLWRRWAGKMEILHRYRMDSNADLITTLCWSPWTLRTSRSTGKVTAASMLAVGDAKGRLWSLEISQDVTAPRVQLLDQRNVEQDASGISAAQPLLLGKVDGRAVTQFCWVFDKPQPKLVYTKLGTVNVVEFAPEDRRSPVREIVGTEIELKLPLVGEATWMGATPYASCAGIVHVPDKAVVVVGLSSGAFYTLSLYPKPTLVSSSGSLPTSTDLTAAVRQIFVENSAELRTVSSRAMKAPYGSKTTRREGVTISGLALLGAEFGWLEEAIFPDLMWSQPNSNHQTTFVLAPLLEPGSPERELEALRSLLQDPPNCRLKSSLGRLRSVLQFIAINAKDASFLDALFALLHVAKSANEIVMADDKKLESIEEVTAIFLLGLFGDTYLEGLRMRETVARFIERLPSLEPGQRFTALVLQAVLARQTAQELAARIGVVFSRAQSLLTTEDVAVSGRILLAAASLQATPAESDSQVSSPDALSMSFEGPEVCPACGASVPFANIRHAECTNGHKWERCSLSLALLATVNVRTCVGCERKASLPDVNGEGVLNALLLAATCCLYCGGRFMRIR